MEATRHPLDERFPEWGESPYFSVTLRATEVVEHLDLPRLAAFEQAVFEFARPATVILTNPEPGLQPGLGDPARREVPPP